MRIAAFYENIYDGVRATGRRMEDVLSALHEAGLEMLYMTPDSWMRDRRELSGIMERLNREPSVHTGNAFHRQYAPGPGAYDRRDAESRGIRPEKEPSGSHGGL